MPRQTKIRHDVAKVQQAPPGLRHRPARKTREMWGWWERSLRSIRVYVSVD